MPYGEVDAASHYAVADYTKLADRSITTLPYYIDMRYGGDNKFEQHVLWYPPPFHTGLAIAAVFGGEGYAPIFIANAIFCSLIILSIYFIMRKFFGFEAALVSSLLLIFSMRDIMVFLWGQWPERMGFAYLPLILYCFYKYCTSYLNNKEKRIYIYIMPLLLAVNFFIHPMDFFHSVAALVVLGLFFLLKERRLFFSIKHVFAAIILFLFILSIFPSQTLNVFIRTQSDEEGGSKGDFTRLFYWFKPQKDNAGVPQSYFSYKEMIGPYWTIPFILVGVLFLLLRRNRKDLVMLAWLVSLYIMIHLDVLGKGRVHRSLSGTAHLFYPLIVLGIIYFISLIPVVKGYKSIIKYGVLVVFSILMIFSIGVAANKSLGEAYGGISRVNSYQSELMGWLIESDVPKDAQMYHVGAISPTKTRWMWMAGHRFIATYPQHKMEDYNITHVIIDYSDFALIGNQEAVNQVKQWEIENLVNSSLIYDKDYLKVYKLEH